MPKAHHKHILSFFIFLLLLSVPKIVMAQDENVLTSNLIDLLQNLEAKYDVKFSYVDKDIGGVAISIPKTDSLQEILNSIQNQTQVKIQKLNERYYTVTKSTTVDIVQQYWIILGRTRLPVPLLRYLEVKFPLSQI